MPKKKVDAQTVYPLETAPPIEKISPEPIDTQALIRRLYELAMDGNVTAAKVVLDCCREQEKEGKEPNLTPGEILALIRTSMLSLT